MRGQHRGGGPRDQEGDFQPVDVGQFLDDDRGVEPADDSDKRRDGCQLLDVLDAELRIGTVIEGDDAERVPEQAALAVDVVDGQLHAAVNGAAGLGATGREVGVQADDQGFLVRSAAAGRLLGKAQFVGLAQEVVADGETEFVGDR